MRTSIGLPIAILIGLFVALGFSQVRDAATVRREAQRLQSESNWKDALDLWQQLATDPNTSDSLAASDLLAAFQCQNQLRLFINIDPLLQKTLEAHPRSWQVYENAARLLMQAPHVGIVSDQKFTRSPQGRVSGQRVSMLVQDRQQSLQWLNRAIQLTENSDAANLDRSRIYLQLADTLLDSRSGQFAWRLQTLTNITSATNYLDLEVPQSTSLRYASVDEGGNPVFYELPASWESAKSDGERFRWSIVQSMELDVTSSASAEMRWADFLYSQFSVETLAQDLWLQWRNRVEDTTDDKNKNQSAGLVAIHTLAENETIARLANGVRRFALPDDFNPIRVYQRIADHQDVSQAELALQRLTTTFLNRRQFPKAVEYLRESMRRFGDATKNKKPQIDSIIQPRGIFDPLPTQVAGDVTKVSFVYRNAKKARFSAVRVDIEKLLADKKAYYRNLGSSASPGRSTRSGVQPWSEFPADLLGDTSIQKYVGPEVAAWDLVLTPRENHWDRRIEVETPLRNAGLYVITASLDNGQHSSRCLMWVHDTAIIRKALDRQVMYIVTDAKSGQPLPNMNMELFGYNNTLNGQSPPQPITKLLAKKTDAQGRLIVGTSELNQYNQWSITARDGKGRLGLLGFNGIANVAYDSQNQQPRKAYGVSDRPAYRPGDTVHAKFWIAHAYYGVSQGYTPSARITAHVQLMEPQGKVFWKGESPVDDYGGVEFEIPVPKSATLGAYTFQVQANFENVQSNLRIRVEEYRKPEFEVTIQSPSDPIALGETFKARVRAKYYFGTPVTDGTVHIKVERTAFTDRFYPTSPYDWCYGPGYWWFAYDYPWYPAWRRWVGCIRPVTQALPRFGIERPELVLEQELPLDALGEATVNIDTALAKEIQGDQDHRYNIIAEVRDASRRTISSSGQVIAARQAFKIYCWTHRGYYRTGDPIDANFQARMLDSKPIQGSGSLQLMKISYDANLIPIETPVQEWKVTTNENGQLNQRMRADQSGQYRLRLRLTDAAGHEVEGGYIFTIRGPNDAGGDFRYGDLELIPDQQQYNPGDKVQLQINADRDDARVFLFVRPVNGIYLEPRVVQLQAKSTIVEIDVQASDQPNFFVEAVSVYDGRVHTVVREIIVPPENRVLDVHLTTDKKEYLPGEEASVNVQVTDPIGKPVIGSTVIAVYDRSLESIAPEAIPSDIRAFFWKFRRRHNSNHFDNLAWVTNKLALYASQAWTELGLFGSTLADDAEVVETGRPGNRAGMRGSRGPVSEGAARGGAPFRGGLGGRSAGSRGGAGGRGGRGGGTPEMDGDQAEIAASRMSVGNESVETSGPNDDDRLLAPSVRKDFADSAFWLGKVTTDAQGRATAKVKMPENLTSWKIRSWSVGSGVRVGSGSIEVVTRKNLLVRLQVPRFLVERDEVVLSALVNNDLSEAKEVRVRLEIDGQTQLSLLPSSPSEQTIRVESHGQARVDWRCKALAEGTVTLRTIAISDVESDAMQLKTPILVNGLLKTDSLAGTIRTDQANSTATLRVPNARRVEHSKLVINLSPSLAAAMIDALPYLADYQYGCTEQTLNRFLPTVITQHVLREMQIDLASLAKTRNNLNAQEIGDSTQRRGQWQRFGHNPVYESKEVDLMVDSGLSRLSAMQNTDGGWGWFSGFGGQSYPHTTAIVVRGLLIARENDIAMVPDVLQRGLAWLDRYQQMELQKLKNAAMGTNPYKKQPDSLDALVFHILVRENRVNPEMQRMLYEKRDSLGAYGKSLLALATHKLGNVEQTKMLRQNIEQFLVEDAENETAYLRDNSPRWYWYGSEIESAAMYLKLLATLEPKGRVAPRLVKYLLNNRKHATYWSSTRDTALVVEAFAEYLKASGEIQANVDVEVWLDSNRIGSVAFTPKNLFDVDNRIVLSGKALPEGDHKLEIRRTGDGPIYWNAYLTNFTLEEEIAPSGLELKIQRRYYRLDPARKELTVAGDRGQVIEANRSGFDRITLEDLQALPSGTLVEVELLVESKNDYEYLLIEDRKPAGLEPIDTQSGYLSNRGVGIYRELRDQTVSFFIQQLPRGQHSLRYRLRSEAPGVFTALPAQISGMYSPELFGNSADFDLKVIDR